MIEFREVAKIGAVVFGLLFILLMPSTRWPLFSLFTFRFTYSEFFGVLCILSSLIGWLRTPICLNFLDWSILLFAGYSTINVLFSQNPSFTILESSVIIYFFALNIAFRKIFTNDEKIKLCFSVLVCMAIVVPFLAASPFFRPVTSVFRNTGGAGDFSFCLLTLLVPLSLSSYGKVIFPSRISQLFLVLGITLSSCFLFVSIKISAVVGFLVSLIFLLWYYKKRFAIPIVLFGFLVGCATFLLVPAIPVITEWKEQLLSKQFHFLEDDGIYRNMYTKAWYAFTENPFCGTGLGAFKGNYFHLEVHSSYFKILVEMGVLGFGLYLFFLKEFIRTCFSIREREDSESSIYARYLWLMQPFFIGHMVTWLYSYHFRKREFWLILSIYLVVHHLHTKTIEKRKGSHLLSNAS